MNSRLSLRLPDDLAARLLEVGKETKRSSSFLIREALELYLAEIADLQIAYDRLYDINDPVILIYEIKAELTP